MFVYLKWYIFPCVKFSIEMDAFNGAKQIVPSYHATQDQRLYTETFFLLVFINK